MGRTASVRSRPALAALAGAAALATAAASVALSAGAQADVTSVGGGAFGASVDVTPRSSAPVAYGPRPTVTLPAAGGGPFTAAAASANVGRLLATGAMAVSTQGGTTVSHTRTVLSSATVSSPDLLDSDITANAASSTCRSNGDGSSATTSLVGLTLPVGVAAVSGTPAPNTVRTLPSGDTVTFNEQVEVNTPGTTTSIVVNAIHVRLTGNRFGTGDIIVGQSRCSASGPDVLRPAAATSPSPTPTGSTGTARTGGTRSGSAATGNSAGPAAPVEGSVSFTG